jgi:hypothetical protein
MEIYRCYELFLTDRKISGCSEATIRFYEYVIGKLLRFIEENNLDSSVESIHQHIVPFFSHLQQKDLSPSTLRPSKYRPVMTIPIPKRSLRPSSIGLIFPIALAVYPMHELGASRFSPGIMRSITIVVWAC